jgi:Zn-dependent peptidase ImmA (M78 family)
MVLRVDVRRELLLWACERVGKEVGDLESRFPKLAEWVESDARPTLKQLEAFAKATHTPVGYFFLPEPPEEEVPIPDLRTIGLERLKRPSPDLLETLYICLQRQEWYREFARSIGEEPCEFVGSAQISDGVEDTAATIRDALNFDLEERSLTPTWTEALRIFIEKAEEAGVLVMINGVVGSNNHRKLDPQEFRGFALADELAPLVFINGADTKAAQIFTLAHELAHIWLGETALSDVTPTTRPTHEVEIWCNQVAAELLVPLAALRKSLQAGMELADELQRLARLFKVSTLVILRRLHDIGALNQRELWERYDSELKRLRAIPKGSGGNFYFTQAVRVSKRFARALVVSTLEGQTLHRDAFRLLGFSKLSTFRELGHRLGVV